MISLILSDILHRRKVREALNVLYSTYQLSSLMLLLPGIDLYLNYKMHMHLNQIISSYPRKNGEFYKAPRLVLIISAEKFTMEYYAWHSPFIPE